MNVPARLRIVAALLVVTIVVVLFTRRGGDSPSTLTASGTVEATDADLGFQVAGRIASMNARVGDRVDSSQTLARLDTRQLEAQVDAAQAQVAMAQASLSDLESGSRAEEIAQGRAGLMAAQRRRDQAEADLARTRTLVQGGALSQEALDHQETALQLTQAELDRSQEALSLLEQGPRPQRIAAARAALEQARSALAQAEIALAYAQIDAPFPGLIANRHREPGEVVPAGSPVLTLMNPADRWIRIYIREDAIGRVGVGQPAIITADTWPDRQYRGEVVYIADEAEFTPRNVQTREERVKLVFEVRVRILDDEAFDLKPGLPADVDLEPGA